MKSLSLLSFNTLGLPFSHFTERYRKIAEFILKCNADVVNLQEVFSYYHLHQLKQLRNTYKYFIYEQTSIGPKGGLVTFSKYPIKKVNYKTYPFTFNPFGIHLLDNVTRKGILVSKLDSKNIYCVNTHLTPIFNDDWSIKSKYYNHMVLEISEFHKILKSLPGMVVSSGDFNIAKQSDLYRKLMGLPDIIDPFFSRKNSTVIPNMFIPKTTKPICIDYILLYKKTNNINVSEKNYVIPHTKTHKNNTYLSDHIGLFIKIDLLSA